MNRVHIVGRAANTFLHTAVQVGAGLGWRVWFHLAVIAVLIVLTRSPQ